MIFETFVKAFATVLVVIGIATVVFSIAWLGEETTVDRPTQFMLVVVLVAIVGAAVVMLMPAQAWS